MVALTAISYETPSPEVSLGRARLEQARREADQAEAYARQMRATADRAEAEASKGQERVSSLSNQVAQVQSQAKNLEDATYTSQLKKQMEAPISPAKQEALASLSTVARNGFSFPSNPLMTYSRASSLAGLTGAKTSGLIVNQKA